METEILLVAKGELTDQQLADTQKVIDFAKDLGLPINPSIFGGRKNDRA